MWMKQYFGKVVRQNKWIKKKVHSSIIIRRKKASNVCSASLDFSLYHVMQSAFLIPQSPSGQFSAMLAISFQGIAYVNMADKTPSAIKQLMPMEFMGMLFVSVNISIFHASLDRKLMVWAKKKKLRKLYNTASFFIFLRIEYQSASVSAHSRMWDSQRGVRWRFVMRDEMMKDRWMGKDWGAVLIIILANMGRGRGWEMTVAPKCTFWCWKSRRDPFEKVGLVMALYGAIRAQVNNTCSSLSVRLTHTWLTGWWWF